MEDRPFSPLQRLSRALFARTADRAKGTDWWGVLVEIAIVVLGILIAFQLNNWGERRSERRAERVLLQRLAEEARMDARMLGSARQQHLDSADNYELLARAVRDSSLEAEYHQRGARGCNLLRMPAVRRQSIGAVGQAAGARLDLVSDPELRWRLRIAEAQRSFSDRQLDYFRAAFLKYGDVIEPHLIFEFADRGQVACRVSIAGLRQNPAAVLLLPKLYRDHRRFAEYREQEQQSLLAIAERINCLAKDRCE